MHSHLLPTSRVVDVLCMFATNRSNRWVPALAACTFVLLFGGLLAAADARTAPAATVAAGHADVDPASDAVVAAAAAPVTPVAAPTPTTAPPAPATTVASPAPVTTAPQPPPTAPAPPPPAAPPAPRAPTPAPAPARTPEQTVQAAYEAAVPTVWRNAIPVTLRIIPGSTSWGHSSGLIEIGETIVPRWDLLRTTLAHEFGHLIAYGYGSQAYLGAAPAGWPEYSDMPVEGWADCVAWAFTGIADPSHGLPPCPSSSLSWTQSWLAQGPGAHPRTR
jgi:hypothetical protein